MFFLHSELHHLGYFVVKTLESGSASSQVPLQIGFF